MVRLQVDRIYKKFIFSFELKFDKDSLFFILELQSSHEIWLFRNFLENMRSLLFILFVGDQDLTGLRVVVELNVSIESVFAVTW